MSCERIQDRLIEFLDGTLDDKLRENVATHLESCESCSALLTALDHGETNDDDLTRAVMRETAEAACEQSVERLPDWIDAALEPLDAELVAGHVAHCNECRAVAGVMRTMAADLPELAEAPADAAFVDDVLAQTTAQLPAWVDRSLAELAEVEADAAFLGDVMAATAGKPVVVAQPGWVERIDEWFASILRRPRIAWEGAYVVTVCLVLLFAFPGSPLAAASKRALELTRTDPNKLEEPFVAFRTSLKTGGPEAWSATQVAARTFVVRASAESNHIYRSARRGVGTLFDRFASDPVTHEEQTQEEATNGESK